MTKKHALELLTQLREQGHRRWNELRQNHKGDKLDLSGLDLSNRKLHEINFNNCNLSGVSFKNSQLNGSRVADCDLTGTDFSNSTCEKVRFDGSNLGAAILVGANLCNASAQGTKCEGKKFDNTTDLRSVSFADAILNGAEFSNCNLTSAKFGGAELVKARFDGAELHQADFSNSKLHGTWFGKCALSSAYFNSSSLSGAEFDTCRMAKSQFISITNCEDTVFLNSELTGARFEGSQIVKSRFAYCDLRATNFAGSVLTGTEFTASRMSSSTNFAEATVDDVVIEKHTLESLSDYGGLTSGERMRMRIIDDVAKLRSSYSGFWQWVHVIAMSLFIAPYAWFVASHWGTAHFMSHIDGKSESITLLEALSKFVYSGGQRWHGDWQRANGPFAAFLFALVYNVIRFILLSKTKRLELQEQTTGLSPVFSLLGGWKALYYVAKVMFWMNLCIVGYHTIHFMLQDIPIR